MFFCVASQSASAQDKKDAKPPAQPAAPQSAEPKILRPNMSDESALQQTTFSQAVADALLRRLGQGMQGHSLPQTRSVFSPVLLNSGMDARIAAAFDHYESFYVYYKTVEVTGEGEQKGIIVADFDLESRPQQTDLAPRRQHARLRLEVERIPSVRSSQWRIALIDPDRFFFEY